MMPKGLFSQIVMIGLAIGIVFFYIEPTFSEISDAQDDITLFQTERQKVNDVNQQLLTLVDRLNQVPSENQIKLLTYMPDTVDTVMVPRILQTISTQSGALFRGVNYDGVKQEYIDLAEEEGIADFPIPHEFTIDVQGTYSQLKEVVTLIEQNEFPLEVHELTVTVLEGGFLSADIMVVTYSHQLPEDSYFNNM